MSFSPILYHSHIALGQHVEAARLIASRPDLPALKAATEICLAAGEVDTAVTYAQKYVTQCQQLWDWDLAGQLTDLHQRFKVFVLYNRVCHWLLKSASGVGVLVALLATM